MESTPSPPPTTSLLITSLLVDASSKYFMGDFNFTGDGIAAVSLLFLTLIAHDVAITIALLRLQL
jgi:hypothetical protein